MKFASLHLRAFGPFTGTVLDFETGGTGLQIVFGVNEAGKSSALRAVHGLLFGIPARTTDNFIHDNADLRIGAVLIAGDGKRNSLMRRKGNKAVLFEFDEKTGEEHGANAVDQGRINNLLPGVDEALFRMLFGLSHQALREGGNLLLKGEGDLGTTLFSAGSGLKDVKGAYQSLDDEARGFFLSGGNKPSINANVREFDMSRKTMREALVRPQAWKELKAAQLAARTEVDEFESQLQKLQTERRNKQRLRDLRPQAVRRHNLVRLLAELKDVVKLPDGARAGLVTARGRAESASQQIAETRARIASNNAQIAVISVSKLHLNSAKSIEAQHHSSGAARDGHQQLLALGATLAEKQKEIVRLLADLSPGTKLEAAESILPSMAASSRLKVFVRQLTQAVPARSAAQANGEKAKERLQAAEAALQGVVPPGDISRLEAAIEAVQREGEPERSLSAAAAKMKGIEQDVRRRCAALEHDEQALVSLHIPQKATIEKFKKSFQTLETEEAKLSAEEVKLRDDSAQRQIEIRKLEAKGNVATAEAVAAARKVRDGIWSGVRRAYVERDSPPATVKKKLSIKRELPDEYERQVQSTDDLADLFHADTERATKYSGLQDRIKVMAADLERIAKKKAELTSAREVEQRAWSKLLGSLKLSDRGPEALLEWLRDHEQAVKRIGERDDAMAERIALEAAISRARETLDSAYAKTAVAVPKLPTLAAYLSHARAQLRTAQERSAKIESLQKDKKSADRDIAAARAEVAKFGAQIVKLTGDAADDLKMISLTPAATADEIQMRLDHLEQFRTVLREARETQASINVAKTSWDSFVNGMLDLAKQLEIEAPKLPEQFLALAASLYEALEVNRKTEAQHEKLEAAIAGDAERVGSETAKLELANKAIGDLVVLAKCDNANSLDGAIAASERLREAERALQELDDGLRNFSKDEREGLLQAAAAEDPDVLDSDIARLDAAVVEIEPRIKGAQAKTTNAEVELAKIDGAALAVTARETMEHHAAAIQHDSLKYVRIRLAHALLGKAIRTYQERSQGPLVDRASAWFALITENRYMRLVADHDEDAWILLAVRSDGKRLKVGELSEGTADQLFLALRLAAIEGRLETSPPVPLILDDVLLAFDDHRSAAALKALAKLAKSNQVILFTHHRHIVELAGRELRADEYGTHELKLAALSV